MRVATRLRAAGYEVFTLTLTGLGGERFHLANPSVDVNTHIRDIVATIENEELSGVVLCGHSYAGMVITGVADRVPDRIAHLVYLDAFIAENGKSALELLTPEIATAVRAEARVHADGAKRSQPFTPEGVGVFDPADQAWLKRRLVEMPLACHDTKISLTGAGARVPRRTDVYCNDPVIGGFERFAEATKKDSRWRYVELKTGHDAMISAPKELADLLLRAS